MLVAKYGRPADLADHEAVWTHRAVADTTTGDCERGQMDARWSWDLAGKTAELSPLAGETPTTPTLSVDPAVVYRDCGPTLRMRNFQLMGTSPTLPLETQLFDLGVLSWLFDQSKAPAVPKPDLTSKIKF